MTCSGLVYLLLLQILAVQSVFQNVTRLNDENRGDIFSNPDGSCHSADSCWEYNNIAVGGSAISEAQCKCSCYFDNTFVVDNSTCMDNSKVHTNLRALLPAKDASFRVTSDNDCRQGYRTSEMPVLDITKPDDRTLCIIGTVVTKCNVIKTDSKYFYEGKWYQIWRTNREQDAFTITENDDSNILEWKSLGQQFTGLIFALKISCQLKGSGSDAFGSYLIFKSAGWHYFNDNKPTLVPTPSAPTSEARGPSSTTASPSKSGKGANSSSTADKGLIAGVSVCVILVLIVIITVVVFCLRRKRNDEKPSEGAECEANPTYELGQDRTIPVTANGQTPAYDYPDTSSRYQPLVQNTRMRDASGNVPAYAPLNRQTKNNNSPSLQIKTPDKRGLAYETVAIPIQQPATDDPGLAESPDYEDPTNPTNQNEGGLYAVSKPQDSNTIDFENTAYSDPDSVINIG